MSKTIFLSRGVLPDFKNSLSFFPPFTNFWVHVALVDWTFSSKSHLCYWFVSSIGFLSAPFKGTTVYHIMGSFLLVFFSVPDPLQ